MPSGVVTEEAGLRIKCEYLVLPSRVTSADISGNNDSHESLYPWDWIMKHRENYSSLLDKDSIPIPASAGEPEPYVIRYPKVSRY